MRWVRLACLGAALALGLPERGSGEEIVADVVVYKANPGGIAAALAAARGGARVALIEPTAHVGGIIAQGALGASDVANYGTIGGLSREFFRRVGAYYKAAYGPDSPQLKDSLIGALEGGQLEPRIAEQVFERFLSENPGIRLLRGEIVAGIEKEGARIVSISCRDGKGERPVTVRGKVFIDASYCGDLMALAKVSYFLGSEGRDKFGESLGRDQDGPQIQAYNYRVTLTSRPEDRVPIEKPEGYDPKRYEGLVAHLQEASFPPSGYSFQYHLPNQKLDSNFCDMPELNWPYPEGDAATRERIERAQRNYSLGYFYFLQNDPRVPPEYRRQIAPWGLAKDEFPDNGHFPREIYVREGRRLDGVYVLSQRDLQQARRKPDSIAVGSIAIDTHATQSPGRAEGPVSPNGGIFQPVRPYDIPYRSLLPKPDQCGNLLVPVCLASTHVAWSSVRMEPVFMMTGEAAGIAAALAAAGEMPVQQVPVDRLQAELKAHGGYLHAAVEPAADFGWPEHPRAGEPVRFEARAAEGSPAPVAYYWNFDGGTAVQSREEKPVWTFPKNKAALVTLVVRDAAGLKSGPLAKIVPLGEAAAGDAQIDSEDAQGTASQGIDKSAGQTPYYGTCFFVDSNRDKGKVWVSYSPRLQAGTYALYVSSLPGPNRAANTLVEIDGAQGRQSARIDQSRPDPLFGLIHVGDFAFTPDKPVQVTLRNDDTTGYVIYDAVRWVLK